MTDYFLEDWDEEPPQETDPVDLALTIATPILRRALEIAKQDYATLFSKTDTILHTMQISDEHRAKLQALGYLSEVVF